MDLCNRISIKERKYFSSELDNLKLTIKLDLRCIIKNLYLIFETTIKKAEN